MLKTAGVTDKELQLATRLIDDMTEVWKPATYRDTYRDDLLRRIEQKVKAGRGQAVAQAADEPAPARGAQVIDLMAALTKSLEGKRAQSGAVARGKPVAKTTPRKRA